MTGARKAKKQGMERETMRRRETKGFVLEAGRGSAIEHGLLGYEQVNGEEDLIADLIRQ